jgi:hypothetical protein
MKTLGSISEIVRVGGWALRGIGFPFGVAERGTRLLAWTEAVHGGAIRSLSHHEATIARAGAIERIGRMRQADGSWQVTSHDRHLLEVGPPLVDLATSDARLRGVGCGRLRGATGFIFVTALADLLVQRRLTGLCVYRAPEDDELPASLSRAGWILSGTHANGAVFASGGADHPLLNPIQSMAATVPLFSALKEDLAEVTRPGGGFLAVTALADGHELAGQLMDLVNGQDGASAVQNYPERVADAYRNGISMEAQDLQDLYDLEIRTWAPTSERSRSQAGYGKF